MNEEGNYPTESKAEEREVKKVPLMPDEVATCILERNFDPFQFRDVGFLHAGDVRPGDVIFVNGTWRFLMGKLPLEGETDGMSLVMLMCANEPIGYAVATELRLACFIHYESLLQH